MRGWSMSVRRRLRLRLAAWSVVCCLLCVCRVRVVVVGSELEGDVLAFADAVEVGLLVVGDVVVAEIEGCQCPDGETYIRGGTEG